MRARSGLTTLNKVGLGTVNVENTAYTSVNGTANDARANFAWNVIAGRLNWNQTDTGAKFNGMLIGTLQLQAAGSQPGDKVMGRVRAEIYQMSP